MTTLLEQLGGREAVEMVVAGFYEKVLADPLLKGYFRGVQMSRLYKNQADFFCAALGDPEAYHGRDMRSVHAGMGIGDEEFDAVARHLSATLTEAGVAQEQVNEVISLIAPLRRDIVTKRSEPKVTMQHQFYSTPSSGCPMHAARPHGSRWTWPLFALALIMAAVVGVAFWKGVLPLPH